MRRLVQSTQLATGGAGLGHFPEFLAGQCYCSNWKCAEKLPLSLCWETAHPRQTLLKGLLATHTSGTASCPHEPGLSLIHHQSVSAAKQLQDLVDLQFCLSFLINFNTISFPLQFLFFFLFPSAHSSSTTDCQ